MAAAGLMVPEGVDPIEDLPPSDPRRRVAEAHMEDAAHLLRPWVSSVEYGSLPVGFQQVLPRDSGPVPLCSGRRYRVLVLEALMGEDEASTVFEAR
jgi:hypothetical protein